MSAIIQLQLNQIHVPFYSSQAAQSTVVNSGSVSSPIKQSPLTSISNLPSNTPKSSARFKSPLSKHIEVIPAPVKQVKTVLTSAECIQIFEAKKHKNEQEALAKEERRKERERKRLEREELAK